MNAHNTIENTRDDRAWDGFAADAALWVERAGEHLSALAHRHGVQVTRHEIEAGLIEYVGRFEGTYPMTPAPETATAADARAGIADMARRVTERNGAQWADAAGDVVADAYFDGMNPKPASTSNHWRGAARAIAIDAYLDGLSAGARVDTFAASLNRVIL